MLEGIYHEVIHDQHTFLGNASVGVHLLEDLEDVALESLNALSALGLDDRWLGSRLSGLS